VGICFALIFALRAAPASSTPDSAASPSAPVTGSADLDHSMAEFRAAAERLERAVTRTARENTQDLSRKFDQGANSMLSDISKALNEAAAKLEKKSTAPKAKTEPQTSKPSSN
jgi:hypothetical protein